MLSAKLEQKADSIFRDATNQSLIGVDYLLSPQKRHLDVVSSFVVGATLSPVIAAALACVYAYDLQHPVVKLDRYVSYPTKTFKMRKIRNMIDNAHLLEPALFPKGDNMEFKRNTVDTRITPVGRILRRTSLDETLQLWNVIEGTMSMVGPRPFSDGEWARLIIPNKEDKPQSVVISALENGVRPGITGMYGICGRINLSFEERLLLEQLYIQNANLRADLRIIRDTVGVVLKGTGAK